MSTFQGRMPLSGEINLDEYQQLFLKFNRGLVSEIKYV